MNKTVKQYEESVLAMCQEFVDLMCSCEDERLEITQDSFVGQEIGDVIEIWDMYLNVGDIKRALEADMTYEEFEEWYYANDEETQINLRSWLMGLRPQECTGNTCTIDLTKLAKTDSV